MIIVLSGYMASGKSSTGRVLSQRLGCPFIDLDAAIEEREGRRIKEIFAADGEERFRELEAEVLAEILAGAPADLVLALGGGTLMKPAARAVLEAARSQVATTAASETSPAPALETSPAPAPRLSVVYLRTAPATIRRRLAGQGDDRPMLHTHDLETLLLQRIPTYEATADTIIDTDGLTPEAIAEKISIFAYNNRTT